MIHFQQFYWANQLVLYVSSGIVKIAVALVLYRLATTVRNQAILVTSICVVVVWTCITTIFSTDMCATTGAADYAGSAVCTGVGYFRMISNIFLDYFYALYPIPMLWRSTLSQRMKIIVCCLLGLGIMQVNPYSPNHDVCSSSCANHNLITVQARPPSPSLSFSLE